MATLDGRSVLGDVTNVTSNEDPSHCKFSPVKGATSTHSPSEVTKKCKGPVARGKRSEKMQDMVDAQEASDEVLASMRSSESSAFWTAGLLTEVAPTASDALPRAAPSRNFAVWMFGHLVSHFQMSEDYWLDCMVIFDAYCLHRPDVHESASLPTVCAAIARLVKKFDDAEPKEYTSSLPSKASHLAQYLQKNGCPHFETRVTQEDLHQKEADILRALRWNIKLPTVQDWMTVFCARLDVFTCGGLKQLLRPVMQSSFLHARILTCHCTNTSTATSQRVAQGLLCLNLICANVLPSETFGLKELASGGAGAGQQQCSQKSLEFLLSGLEDATGSDIETLKADTHLVNDTLLLLKAGTFDSV